MGAGATSSIWGLRGHHAEIAENPDGGGLWVNGYPVLGFPVSNRTTDDRITGHPHPATVWVSLGSED